MLIKNNANNSDVKYIFDITNLVFFLLRRSNAMLQNMRSSKEFRMIQRIFFSVLRDQPFFFFFILRKNAICLSEAFYGAVELSRKSNCLTKMPFEPQETLKCDSPNGQKECVDSNLGSQRIKARLDFIFFVAIRDLISYTRLYVTLFI